MTTLTLTATSGVRQHHRTPLARSSQTFVAIMLVSCPSSSRRFAFLTPPTCLTKVNHSSLTAVSQNEEGLECSCTIHARPLRRMAFHRSRVPSLTMRMINAYRQKSELQSSQLLTQLSISEDVPRHPRSLYYHHSPLPSKPCLSDIRWQYHSAP